MEEKVAGQMPRQNKKTSYKNGGMKAPDIAALDCALKVKQYINATKSKNKIKTLQGVFAGTAAPVSMTQMVYDPKKCNNTFIKKSIRNNKQNEPHCKQ